MDVASLQPVVGPRRLPPGNPAAHTYARRDGLLPALHDASCWGDAAGADVLLRKGAEVGAARHTGDTALHWAAVGGHVEVMVVLLEAGADVTADCDWDEDKHKWQPLHWASRGGQVHAIQMLLDARADVHSMDQDGITALHCAGWSGRAEAVKKLVAAGADVHARDKGGMTALHYAGWSGRAEAVNALVGAGADVHTMDDMDQTALHCGGWSAEAVEALLAAGAAVGATDRKGRTALHMAGRSGTAKAVDALVTKGADVNAIDHDAWTALHFAASNGGKDAVAALLRHGAGSTPVSHTGETPLSIAAKLGHRKIIDQLPSEHPPDAVSTPALEAVRHSRLELFNTHQVLHFLHAADEASGDRVLHMAARRVDVRAVVTLLRLGVNVGSPNALGQTPLAAAMAWLDKFLSAKRNTVTQSPDSHTTKQYLRVAIGGAKAEQAAVSDAVRQQLDSWREVVLALLRARAHTNGLQPHEVLLCARVVISDKSLGARQTVRLLCTKRIKNKPMRPGYHAHT